MAVFSLFLTGLLGPLGIFDSGRVLVCKECYQGRGTATSLLDLGKGFLDLEQQLLCDCFGRDDLAGLWGSLRRHGDATAEREQFNCYISGDAAQSFKELLTSGCKEEEKNEDDECDS